MVIAHEFFDAMPINLFEVGYLYQHRLLCHASGYKLICRNAKTAIEKF